MQPKKAHKLITTLTSPDSPKDGEGSKWYRRKTSDDHIDHIDAKVTQVSPYGSLVEHTWGGFKSSDGAARTFEEQYKGSVAPETIIIETHTKDGGLERQLHVLGILGYLATVNGPTDDGGMNPQLELVSHAYDGDTVIGVYHDDNPQEALQRI